MKTEGRFLLFNCRVIDGWSWLFYWRYRDAGREGHSRSWKYLGCIGEEGIGRGAVLVVVAVAAVGMFRLNGFTWMRRVVAKDTFSSCGSRLL